MSRLDRLVKVQRSLFQGAEPPVVADLPERWHALVHEPGCGIESRRGDEARPQYAVEQARTLI